MKHRIIAGLVLTLAVLGGACSYETVKPNQVGVKLYDGRFAEEVGPGRQAITAAPWHEVEIVTWKSGVAQSVFTAKADAGDQPGDDSIKVSSIEGGQISLDVTVNYRIDTTKPKCLYRANLTNDNAIRDKLIRPAVTDAFSSISAYLTAKDIKTTRKGELANVVLKYLRARYGQERIPSEQPRPVPVVAPEQKITQTYPLTRVPDRTGCGVSVESVLIPLVTLPANLQEYVDQAIKAESDATRIAIEQKSATAEAERKRIEAEGDAAKVRIRAAADADANREISASLSPTLAQLEAIKACADALAKTNAKVASCGGLGAGGGSNNIVIPAG